MLETCLFPAVLPPHFQFVDTPKDCKLGVEHLIAPGYIHTAHFGTHSMPSFLVPIPERGASSRDSVVPVLQHNPEKWLDQ